MQTVIRVDGDLDELNEYLISLHVQRIMLVCGNSIKYLRYDPYFSDLYRSTGIRVVRFSGFEPNPRYESVAEGVRMFKEENCDMIIAAGGGSAIDVAKCIKAFAYMDNNKETPGDNNAKPEDGMEVTYLSREIVPNDIPLMAIPTTAGTGSEVTRFAVIYYKGEKQSVSDRSIIPSAAVLDSSVLEKLPLYQKKATMLDAFCHAVESYWSVNSTDESKEYSREAIRLILHNVNGYLGENIIDGTAEFSGIQSGEDIGGTEGTDSKADRDVCVDKDDIKEVPRPKNKGYNDNMQQAAYLAGKAIDITQTTAGHAMCYKLTSLYGIAHGHAAAICVAGLFPYMLEHVDDCIDSRGKEYLQSTFNELMEALGIGSAALVGSFFDRLIERLGISIPVADEKDYAVLKRSVNTERLRNNPVKLTEDAIERIYRSILSHSK
ncbi:MAG: phosphonoacetaldehyde reductase [Lachnospiraceae bacterium]|nr:phosphonoacetaldehyde reductase [Lachnospiraceae bacterium]